jgi:hypothetical protein
VVGAAVVGAAVVGAAVVGAAVVGAGVSSSSSPPIQPLNVETNITATIKRPIYFNSFFIFLPPFVILRIGSYAVSVFKSFDYAV